MGKPSTSSAQGLAREPGHELVVGRVPVGDGVVPTISRSSTAGRQRDQRRRPVVPAPRT